MEMKGVRRKVITLSEAAAIARRARAKGTIVVTTNGCFDILHVGHVRNLARAKSLGDLLIVGINSDRSVRANKGSGRPIVSEQERAEVIAALEPVDHVFIFNSNTPIEWIHKVRPSVHVKGADRAMKAIVEKKAVERYGGRVKLIRYHKGKSSTDLIRRAARSIRASRRASH